MRIHHMILLLPLLLLKTSAAENLLPDPEFDQSIKTARADYAAGTFKMTRITEAQTWNKALRLEYLKPVRKEGKPDSCYMCILWGTEKGGGVPVKPDTIYEFSLELKGNMPSKSAFLLAIEWTDGNEFWKSRRRLRLDGGSILKKFTASENEYQVVKGTFRTSAQAKRAAFGVVVRGDAKSNNMPNVGDWLLVDRISLKEVSAQMTPQQALQPVKLRECRLLTCGGKAQSGFIGLRSRQDAGKETQVAVNAGADAFEITVSGLHSPRPDFISGDQMEIIFDPTLRQEKIQHFAVSFEGKRTRAGKSAADETDWSAKVIPGENNTWQACFTIPYRTLGLSGDEVKSGILIGFNAGCYRKQGLRFFSWNPIDRDFHNPNLFGRMLTGDGYFTRELDRLGKEIPEKSGKAAEVRKKLAAIRSTGDNQKKFDALRTLEQEIRLLKIGSGVFVLTECLPTHEPEIPVLPDFQCMKEQFEVHAAGNEIRPLTVLLSNFSGKYEEYRVSIFYPGTGFQLEMPGLKSAAGKVFPAEKIQLLRGVQVKDGDGKESGRRFDPLVPVGPAGIYSVPANGTGLVWINFDTAGVPPGRYSGVIRVVPLSEPLVKSKSAPKNNSSAKWRDFPLTVEVMDFKLSAEPAKPLNMFSRIENEEMFRVMAQLGIRDFHFHPFNFQMSFNPGGSIRKFDFARAQDTLANLRCWAANYGISDTMRLSVAYSLYPRFMNLWGKNQFKLNSPEWKKGWSECVRAIAGAFRKLKVSTEKYSIELWDEPPPGKFEELYEAARVAREAAPEIRWMVTFDSRRLPVDKLRRLYPFIDIWVFWGKGYFTSPEYAAFAETLRRDPGRKVSFYTCYTSMRQHLNEYYRLHGLWAWAQKLDEAALYQFIDAPNNHTGASNWISTCKGGVAYFASGHTISSVRMECLRLGHTDIRYFQLLDSLVKKHPRHPAAAAAAAFLAREPLETVLKYPFDSQRPEQLRKQCIELIMKFKEKEK